MNRLEIRLLGPFEVILDGEPVEGFESMKVRALLAYLATETARPQQRDSLAGLLWPNWPQKSALSNLRYALSDLRKNIADREADPPFLLITRQTIQFNPHADSWTDVSALDRGARQQDIEKLQNAIDLYRAEFLEGFTLDDSPEFEQWVLARRQHFHQQALQVLSGLAKRLEQESELDAALTYARRYLILEPWNETGHQQVMRLLALTGQRSAALAQFEDCRTTLRDELGVELSSSTQHLYNAILNEDLLGMEISATIKDLTKGEIPPAPGEPPYKGLQYFDTSDHDIFFGREALTKLFVDQIRQMATSIPVGDHDQAFLAVIGASGSGKSSLIRAGVIPALMQDNLTNWRIHTFTPTAYPLEALSVSLTQAEESLTAATTLLDDLAKDSRSLRVYAQRIVSSSTRNTRLS